MAAKCDPRSLADAIRKTKMPAIKQPDVPSAKSTRTAGGGGGVAPPKIYK